jgi:hypothetical protein
VQMAHHVFSAFDTVVESLRLFKMDTIGDGTLLRGVNSKEREGSAALSPLRRTLLSLASAHVAIPFLFPSAHVLFPSAHLD